MALLPNSIESPAVRAFVDRVASLEPTFVFLGTRPQEDELAHSYHRSWLDSPHDDGYSVHFLGDKTFLTGKKKYACGVDYSFREGGKETGKLRTDLLIKYTSRLHKLVLQTKGAHWNLGIREFACTLDGEKVFAFDCTLKEREFGWDDSHLSHTHIGFNRRRILQTSVLLRLAKIFED